MRPATLGARLDVAQRRATWRESECQRDRDARERLCLEVYEDYRDHAEEVLDEQEAEFPGSTRGHSVDEASCAHSADRWVSFWYAKEGMSFVWRELDARDNDETFMHRGVYRRIRERWLRQQRREREARENA